MCATSLVILNLSYKWLGGPLDLGVYLSSAKALAARQSAWDSAQLNAIAHANHYLPAANAVLGLWTPPTAALLLLPLTFLPFGVAAWLWLTVNELILLLEFRILRQWIPSMPVRGELALWLFFPPAFFLLLWGQISGLVLLGYLLFVYLVYRDHDFWAGVSLVLTTFKPHLGYLVWIFLAGWILQQRRWQVVAGFGFGLLVMFGFVFIVHPAWLVDYQFALSKPPLIYEAASPFRMLYRYVFPDQSWIQFIGLIISMAGLLVYLIFRHGPLNLLPAVPTLLLYSLVFSPYGWAYDQIVALPVFLWLAHDLFSRHPAWWVWSLVAILGFAYYIQASDGWTNNDSRQFWFPIVLAICWTVRLTKQGSGQRNIHQGLPWKAKRSE
jgi:hypothetical protein